MSQKPLSQEPEVYVAENLISKTAQTAKGLNPTGNSALAPASQTSADAGAAGGDCYCFNIPSEDAPAPMRAAFLKALGVPDSSDGYAITVKDRLFTVDPEVNERLRALGFTNRQVQEVYDLAAEKVGPCIHELAAQFEANRQLDKLIRHFGSEEKWREVSRQIHAWGTQNLPTNVYEPLSTTYEGVLALYSMMGSKEPSIGKVKTSDAYDDEAVLKKLMQSTKYWRDKDPATLKRVTEGFQRLYPDNR